MTLSIAFPKLADIPRLTEIAFAAKRHWDYPEEWIQLWAGELTVTPEQMAKLNITAAWLDGELVGFCALGLDSGAWSLEGLWVLPSSMGHGVGRALLEHAKSELKAKGVTCLRIVSDPNAEGFYRKMGAKRVGWVPSKPEGRQLPVLELMIV